MKNTIWRVLLITLVCTAIDAYALTPRSPTPPSTSQLVSPCVSLGAAFKCPSWVSTFNGVGQGPDTPGDNFENSHIVATSPDSRFVYIAGATTNKSGGVDFLVLAYDTEAGVLQWSFEFPGMSAGLYAVAYAIAVSPDGSRVYFSGTSDISGLITVALSATTGQMLWLGNRRYFDGPPDLAVSNDGQRVFVCGIGGFVDPSDGQAHVKTVTIAYDAATGSQLWWQYDQGTPAGDTFGSRIVSSYDSTRVYVSAGSLDIDGYTIDSILYVYDAATGDLLNETHHSVFGLVPQGLAITPDGSHVFSVETVTPSTGNGVLTIAYDANGNEVWNTTSPGPCGDSTCSAEPWYFAPVTTSPDSRTTFVTSRFHSNSGKGGFATVAYDAASGAQKWVAEYDGDLASDVSNGPVITAKPDGSELYVAGATLTGAVTLAYDAATGQQNWVSLFPRGGPNGIAVTPDGSKVITVGNVPGYLVHSPNATDPSDPADVFVLSYDTGTTPMAPSGLQLTDVVSRKSHNTAGTFDVHFADDGIAGIEPRSGGPNGEHTIVFTFSAPLLGVASANVDCGAVASSAVGPGSNQYTVNLTGEDVCNGKFVSIDLEDVIANDGSAATTVLSPPIGLLLGDTNGDGFVNSADIGQTKSQSGQPVTSSNFREDVNADGFINSADIGLVKSKSGTAVP